MENTQLIKFLPPEVADLAVKVADDKKLEVENTLSTIFEKTATWEQQVDAITVKDINDTMSIEMADIARKNAKKYRVESEKIFDAKREIVQRKMVDYKTEDQLWLKAKQIMQIRLKAIEEKAEYKAKFVERYKVEQLEVLRLQRVNELQPYAEFLPSNLDLANMSQLDYDKYLSVAKVQLQMKIEAQQKAEYERLEREKILNLHNERKNLLIPVWNFISDNSYKIMNLGQISEAEFDGILVQAKQNKSKQEKEVKEREIERQKLQKQLDEQKAIIAKRNNDLKPYIVLIRDYNKVLNLPETEFQKELKQLNKAAIAEANFKHEQAEKQRKENELQQSKLKAERDQREKLEKEIADKKAADLKEQKEREKADLKAKSAPDKLKLLAFASRFDMMEKPEVTSPEAQKIIDSVNVLLSKVSDYIRKQVKETL